MKVLLTNQTIGEVETAIVGEIVTVSLHDENGLPIEVTGEVEEIF